MHHPDFDKLDFSALRISNGGGMAVQQAVAEKWKKITGVTLVEGYGLTETSPVVTTNPPDMKEFNGTIGLPIPSTEISIRDDAGKELPLGQPGEICIRGPQVMAGYWQRPEETAKVMTADGYFRTGDIGIMDEKGYMRIVDRKKDMILVSGFNVYPNEIEGVVMLHPRGARVRGRRRARRAFGRGGQAVRGEERSESVGKGSARALPSEPDRLQMPQVRRVQVGSAQDQRRKDSAAGAARREAA